MRKLGLILLLVSAAFAANAAPTKAPATPTTIKCAVMPSDVVNIAAATKAGHFADYKGNRYFFCCSNCPSAFKANPSKYAKHDHIKTPKKTA